MASVDPPTESNFLLASSPPTRAQRRWALAVAALLSVAFVATLPFDQAHLSPLAAFIPTLQGVFSVADLITAVLLYSQFSIDRSRSLLVLASGYFFAALITTAFSLTFPGAFTPTGLFGAGLQSAAWLYMLWHFGFSATVLSYAWLRDADRETRIAMALTWSAIRWSVVFIFCLICVLTWFVTAQQEWLPQIFYDRLHLTQSIYYITGFCVLLNVVALGFLWLRKRSILDQWLMVVVLTMNWELLLNVRVTARFDLGFYAGRIYTLVISITVLILLIAEAAKLGARLARTNSSLQRERDSKMMTLAAMAASISHEVRQPLMAITMNGGAALQYLARPSPDTEAACDMLRALTADIGRAREVLDNIRDLFKGNDQADHPIDLNEIVRGALGILRTEMKERGIAVRAELTPELPHALGHRGQLEQVILNLLNNAIDATGATAVGNPILRVRTKLHDPGGIALTIEDSGEGIEPERLASLFDPFVTSKEQGMGLGLAIARLIVERHGGQISASSSATLGGALFQVTLPLLPSDGL